MSRLKIDTDAATVEIEDDDKMEVMAMATMLFSGKLFNNGSGEENEAESFGGFQ